MATLIFSGWNYVWWVALLLSLSVVALFWSYRAAPSGWPRWICPLLKAGGLLALGLCLLEPLWSGQRVKPGANLFVVVADNSQGLQIHDRGSSQSRGEALRDLLAARRGDWQEALDDNFEVRRYYFDARLQPTKAFTELDFNGHSSRIGSALQTLAERYRNRPLAGILLFTDGNATDLRGVPDLTGLPPIYPVVIGSSEPVQDIAVEQVHTTQTDFEDAPVSIQADVTAHGYQDQPITAQLLDSTGKMAAEQVLTPRKGEDVLAFRFQLRPQKQGLCFYRLNVRARSELSRKETSTRTSEATLANNSTVLVVDRGRGPYRILYVSGRPNWEFKFLNRAAQEDEQLQLVGLVRVAKREPKFNFMGRAGEASNPLYRGFDNQSPEQVERYDQPVMIRLNTRDEFELRAGFPRTPEELYAYHAVILDDLESGFFSPDQATLLQKFVSERGGGFLMLGGMETFQEGNYQRTPIGDMLPVYLGKIEETNAPGPLRYGLTREGYLQSWARVRDNENDEKARLQTMAPFHVLNRVKEPKPGASVISTVTDAGGKSYPALVVQRFGRGRTAALTLGDFWHWGFHDAEAHHDMDKAWRQMMRWLVTDVPNRVDLTAEPRPEDANGAIALQVRVRDPKFLPLDNASLTLQVQPVMAESIAAGQTNVVQVQVEPSASEPGLYQATFVPRFTGGYQASVAVTNSDGVEVGRAAAGWSTDLAAEEFRSLSPNVSLLEAIAKKTGGEVVPLDRLDRFSRQLPQRHAPVMDAWTFPLWHTPAMFGFALVCLVSEWGIRRWKGMP
ncbi:MAG TPA: glutamine amidotransferase [Patescibacteria group bacterium]|nr:glutamine amidotransferase [Patescibacteria group bacterium]